MSSHPERDQAVERLLQARRQRGAPPDAPATDLCPSSDDIAAWADGDLDAARAAALEAHLASCARCEAIVAVFAKAAPLPTPAWTRWRVLLPFIAVAAAASVALTVWSWKNSGAVPTPISTAARVERAAAPITVPAPPVVAPPVPEMKPVAPQSQSATPPAAKRSPRATAAAADAGAPVATRSALEAKAQATPVPSPPPAPIFAPALAAPPPPAANASAASAPPGRAGANASAAQGQVTVVAESPLVDARKPPPPPAAARQIVAQPPLVDTKKTTTGGDFTADRSANGIAEFTSGPDRGDSSATESVSVAGSATSRGGRGGGRGGGGARPAPAAPSPAQSSVKWRIFPSGAVQRSFDNGSTWSPVSLEAGEEAVAGVAPSPQVCWLVGRAGLVLLMTNGVDFKPVSKPTSADLLSVRIEGVRVIVSAVGGAAFTTVDSGQTWTKQGSLQGFPASPF